MGLEASLSRFLLHFLLEKPPSIEDQCQTDRITTHAGLCRWPRLRYTTYSSPCTANDVTMETYYYDHKSVDNSVAHIFFAS